MTIKRLLSAFALMLAIGLSVTSFSTTAALADNNAKTKKHARLITDVLPSGLKKFFTSNSKKQRRVTKRKKATYRKTATRRTTRTKRTKRSNVVRNTRKTRAARVTRTNRKATRRAGALSSKIKRHARAAGVPTSTALAVVKQESGFRPGVTGRAGEIGLMQIKCQTARSVGYRGSCRGLYNPDTNLRYGMRYLRKALNRGSVGYYNAGIHAKRLPAAAKSYARSVARNKS